MPANDWSELGQCTFFMLSWSDGIEVYFQNLPEALERIPETNILNCDETNVTDDPYEKLHCAERACKNWTEHSKQ